MKSATPHLRRAVLLATAALCSSVAGLPHAAGQANLSSAPPAKPAALSDQQRRDAEQAYLDGARLLDRHAIEPALQRFERAAQLDPTHSEYALAATVAREHLVTALVQQASQARLAGHPNESQRLLAQAIALDPQNAIAAQHATTPPPAQQIETPQLDTAIQADPTLAGAVALAPNHSTQSFHIRADVQQTLTQVTAAFGIRAVFDPTVTRQMLRFDLDHTTYAECMPILLDMTHLLAVPLDAQSIFLAPDTPDNRQRLERQLEETIYLPALTNEQRTELGNVVKNIFDLKQSAVQNSTGTLTLRAPANLLPAINYTLADLIDGGSEVLLDVSLYAIDRSRTRETGTSLPQQFGIYNVNSAAQQLVSQNQSLVNQAIASGLIPANASNLTIALALIASGLVQSSLLSTTVGIFGGGLTQSGITASSNPTFTLALNSSETHALDAVQLRVGDHQSGTFRSGTRYPITTSTYTSGTANSSALSGVTINGVSASSLLSQYLGTASSVTVPQIQYEDLGLTFKASPIVQKTDDVTIHLDLKIEALAGTALNNIPVLASRQIVSDMTLHDGQTALLVSSLSKAETAAVNGTPGLGELPGFSSALSDRSAQNTSSQMVMLVTPHIVRHRSHTLASPQILLHIPQTD
ncbi:MAG: hypothetical protein KGK08_11780 [Acidobacteriota bacterium]|nr:hypothetical protein [Acidobacteriota bacterium]